MTAPATGVFEVYAIRYARRDARSGESFYGSDDHDGPMPMDYYVWLARSGGHTVVVDTGCSEAVATGRGREYIASPLATLGAIGVEPARVEHVVLTHLHYDHAGNLPGFPAATFVVHEEELAFWTGRHAGRGEMGALMEADDVAHLVLANFAGRVRFVGRDAAVLPGLSVHHVGGHSPGLIVVKVVTAEGPCVLASDATHFYANIEADRPFSKVHSLPQMYDAFDTVNELAGAPERVVPGHDPLVMERYPAAAGDLEGLVARIA